MNWEDLCRALALVLVIEGLMPFAVPNRWRAMMLRVSAMDDRELRVIGLGSMIAGVLTLWLIRFIGN